ncbi:MAG: DNA primase [Gammaproteobacteria bacterium]|nr:DNA primase [Gammaproteobacteria bacterium]
MSTELLLARLSGVREAGPGRWMARCPAHEDKRPSLSIRELSDGRVLVHCFGACQVGDVLAAVGLTLTDLFRDRARCHHARPSKTTIPSSDLLLMVEEDVLVASLVAAKFLEAGTLTEDDWQQLVGASRRLGWAAAEIRKIKPWRPSNAA